VFGDAGELGQFASLCWQDDYASSSAAIRTSRPVELAGCASE
jgi:hypothetical protein